MANVTVKEFLEKNLLEFRRMGLGPDEIDLLFLCIERDYDTDKKILRTDLPLKLVSYFKQANSDFPDVVQAKSNLIKARKERNLEEVKQEVEFDDDMLHSSPCRVCITGLRELIEDEDFVRMKGNIRIPKTVFIYSSGSRMLFVQNIPDPSSSYKEKDITYQRTELASLP